MDTQALIATVSSLKSTIAHNIAQNLVADQQFDYYSYLNECVKVLFKVGMPDDHVHDIVIHAWNHAPSEAETVREMYKRYGIQAKVQGHGGSQINPEVLQRVAAARQK